MATGSRWPRRGRHCRARARAGPAHDAVPSRASEILGSCIRTTAKRRAHIRADRSPRKVRASKRRWHVPCEAARSYGVTPTRRPRTSRAGTRRRHVPCKAGGSHIPLDTLNSHTPSPSMARAASHSAALLASMPKGPWKKSSPVLRVRPTAAGASTLRQRGGQPPCCPSAPLPTAACGPHPSLAHPPAEQQQHQHWVPSHHPTKVWFASRAHSVAARHSNN